MAKWAIGVNGQVIGLWRKTSQKKNPLAFEFFKTVNENTKQLIENATVQWKNFYQMPK